MSLEYGTVTVYLNPPLHGAELHLMQRVDEFGNPTNIKVETTYSVNGVAFFSGEPYIPYAVFEVKFISQEVGGVLYSEAFTPQFGFGTKQYEYDLYLVEAGAPTALTISAPAYALPGQPFRVEGILKRSDTGEPLPGETVTLRYDNTPLGSFVTAVDGSYHIDVVINAVGSWTLTIEYAGSPGLGASMARSTLFSGALKYV